MTTKIDFSDSIAKAIAVVFGLFHTEELRLSLWFRLVLTNLEAGPMRPTPCDEEWYQGMQDREITLEFRDEDDDVPVNNVLAVVMLTEVRPANWAVRSVQFTYHDVEGKIGWMEIKDVSSLFFSDDLINYCPDYVKKA